MSRSPLAYPLTRGVDGDSGGAADLQTDIMRFMAILSLCLVAIFALVQSIPLAAEIPVESVIEVEQAPAVVVQTQAEALEPIETAPVTEPDEPVAQVAPVKAATEKPLVLARPKWVPTFQPRESVPPAPVQITAAPKVVMPEPKVTKTTPVATAATDERGFTLRFASDLALTRLVAAGQVGFYAIDAGRAQRMAVSDSRISFWNASTPNAFHEMEATTVPTPVVEALKRTGANTGSVDWGVTLPGKLQSQLSSLMQQHTGGALIIGADGNMVLEAS